MIEQRKDDDVAIVYVCGTVWEHEMRDRPRGVLVYPTLEDLKANMICIAECGAVELEIRVRRWVAPPESTESIVARKLGKERGV